MKQKEIYKGLATKRFEVESSPVMGTSSAKIKVKTMDAGTEEWKVDDVSKPLDTSISSDITF